MSETPIGRHLVARDGGWAVTIPAPGTGAEHARLLMGTLGHLTSMLVPAGRVGTHREVKRALLGHGVAVTVGESPVEGAPDMSAAALLRRFGSEIAGGRRFDRAMLVEALYDAANRIEGR